MLFADAEAIHLLLSPLSPGTPSVELELHEDLITTLLNLSIHDDNKRALAKNEKVVSLIVDSLKMGTVQTRSNATAEVFSMSSIYSNRHILGKSEAIKYLVDLLDEGHPLSMNDAASALFKLCLACENKARTVREGAVQVILGKIVDKVMVDELVSLLVLLAKHSKAVEALVSHGVVLYLLDIVKETTSERVKENCVGILCTYKNEDIFNLPRFMGHDRRRIFYSKRHCIPYCGSKKGVEREQTKEFKGVIHFATSCDRHNFSENNGCNNSQRSMDYAAGGVQRK
ncbi:U-box domain-containing protein 9 [Cajanus cajan]|uniref:U-box domain-containing protein 9 n=1 Tax=Cajanus cajan TaxID=3821 RepID=UPI00098D99DD|nr:U-box domain-containing protein 9 [Cajanus cajan]